MSGTPISLAATPTAAVVGTHTQGLASYIVNPFTGGASREGSESGKLISGCILGILGAYIIV